MPLQSIYMLVRVSIGGYPYGIMDGKAIGHQRTMLKQIGLLISSVLIGRMQSVAGRMQRRVHA